MEMEGASQVVEVPKEFSLGTRAELLAVLKGAIGESGACVRLSSAAREVATAYAPQLATALRPVLENLAKLPGSGVSYDPSSKTLTRVE